MGLLPKLLLGLLLVGIALAAPEGEKESAAAPATKAVAEADATKTLEERGVTVTDQNWEMWAQNNAWGIAVGTFAVACLVGGVALSYYYYYYNYFAYNASPDPYAPYSFPQQYNGQYFGNNARSLDVSAPGTKWNISWGDVIKMITLAQETYEKFDFQSMDCQKKALCELTQKQNDFGETGRKITNTFSVMDTLESLPMPAIVLQYLKEYREAINQGMSSTKDCGSFYPKCGFSIKEAFVKFQKKSKKD